MKKILSRLALFITSTAMAIGVGVVTFSSVLSEVKADYHGDVPYTIPFTGKMLADSDVYVTSETDSTIDGIDLSWVEINPSTGQVRSDKAYIFNTTALPGKITKIILNYTSGTWNNAHAKVGTSAFETSNAKSDGVTGTLDSANKKITWSFNVDNAKYFDVYIASSDISAKCLVSTVEVSFEDPRTPDHIVINNSSTHPTSFYAGDTFSCDGLKVDMVYDNDDITSLTKDVDYTVIGPDMSSAGNKKATITPKAGGKAEGLSAIQYDVTINPGRELESVTLTGDLTNKAYTIGDSWDLTGISVTGNYNDSSHENLGTLNSLITAEKVTYTLDPAKPELGGSTLDIKNLKYEGTYNATENLHITGITVSEKIRYVLFEEETLTAGDYMLVTSDSYAVTNELTDNNKRIVAANDFEITNNCIFEPDSKFSYTVAKDGDYYTFYNSAASKYLAGTVGNESGFVDSVNDYAKWTVTRENGGYKLVNKKVSGYLQKNSTINHFFGCYGNSTDFLGVLYLYKQLPPVVKVTVVDNKTTIGLGGTATITTELLNGAAYTPSFSTDDPGGTYAELVDNGDGTATVRAVSAGTVTITTSALGCEDVETVFTIRDIALVEKITVETQPKKLEYVAGETFSSDGLSIKVTYSDDSTSVKTSGFTTSEVDTSAKGVKVVTVSYTEEEITRTTTFEIVVAYPIITTAQAIEIIKPLDNHTPTAEIYRVTGIVVGISSWSKGSATIDVAEKYNEQDTGKIFQLYNAFADNKTEYDKLQIGAHITIESKLQKHHTALRDYYQTTANPDIIDFDLEVEKLVTGIYVYRNPTKTQYYVGDTTFDYTGLRIEVHYNDGTEEKINYNDGAEAFLAIFDIIDPDTSDDFPDVPVTVIHKETGFSTSFKVDVDKVSVSKITVSKQPNKTTYASGELFDPTGIEITITNNNQSTFVLEDYSDISYRISNREYNDDGSLTVYEGDTYVTVVYINNNYTATIPITVEPKYITGISAFLSEGLGDDTYDIDDTFSTRSLVIHVNYNDGTFDKYTSKNSDFSEFTITPPDMSTAGDKEVAISYTSGGKTYNTTVGIHIRGVELLSIDTEPSTLTYYVGEELDFDGLVLIALYENSDVEDVDPTWESVTITGDTSKDGAGQDITFTYKGASASYKIDVYLTNQAREDLIKSEIAKINSSLKQSDYTAENWASIQDVISTLEEALSDYDTSKEGQHYTSDVMDEIDAAVELINAVPTKVLASLTLSGPTKTTYNLGEELDTTGLVVAAYFEDGSMKFVNLSMCTITGFDSSSVGEKTVTVTYSGLTATFKVTIVDPNEKVLENITLSGIIKNSYEIGEDLDLSGLVVTAHYSDESSEVVTNYTVSGYDKNKVGEQTITITYGDKTATFVVTVVEKAVDPEVEEARASAIGEYQDYFDSLDLSGYSEEIIAQFNALKEETLAALGDAATEEEIAAALNNAKNALNNLLAQNPKEAPATNNTNLGLILGLSIGGGLLLTGGVVALVLILKKKKKVA